MLNSPKLLIKILYFASTQSREVSGWSHGEMKNAHALAREAPLKIVVTRHFSGMIISVY